MPTTSRPDDRRTSGSRRIVSALAFASLSALVLVRCGGSGGPSTPTTAAPTPTTPTVNSVAVTGTAPTVGQSAQFTATAQMSDGSSQNVTTTATWSSSAAAIATVSSIGLVTSVTAGAADIAAAYKGTTGLLHITITAPPVSNPSPTPTPTACGTERWPVKTLADTDATRVDFGNVITTTITVLNQLSAHCSGIPDARTFGEEFHVYEVTGVVQLTRDEDDHDVHIALADPNNTAETIVVEVADPMCATTSPYASMLSQARSSYTGLGALVGKTVTVRGVGFYDYDHGQTGRSLSCVELHPVISIALTSVPAPPPTPTPTPPPVPTPPAGSDICMVSVPISASCGTATAVCKDGTYSCSQNRSGTCSSHGGHSCWICPGPLCGG